MGIFNTNQTFIPEDPMITEDKKNALENLIRSFIAEQKENIISIFNDKDLKTQNIEFIINDNNQIIKEKNQNSLNCIKDFAIQWSIEGNNEANITNCHLTFFNIGGLLGANGLLYAICQFYYFFSKIPTENRSKENIIKDIEKCLSYIDTGNLYELNLIWRANINKDILNDLRIAKDFLINLFHEKITIDIFDNINNNLAAKIMKKM